ncbi:Uncharacterised protein [Vibrio cholerae]|nr:Uncharacterised protein [Vibrio cholerae]
MASSGWCRAGMPCWCSSWHSSAPCSSGRVTSTVITLSINAR